MIKPLTSLRFFFAFFVFLFHLSMLGAFLSPSFNEIYETYFKEGFVGVSFFFILSGFVLAYSYQEKFLNRKINYFNFWIARFARIYPLYLLTTLLSVYQFKAHILETPILWIFKLVLHLFMLQSFIPIPDYYFYFNTPGWSISTEIFFYLVFPFIIGYLASFNKNPILYFVFFSLIVFTILVLVKFIPENLYHALFYINPIFRLADFCLGIITFQLFNWANKNTKSLSNSIFEFIVLIILLIFLYYADSIPKVYKYSIYYWVPISALIFTFAFQKGFISRLLSNKYLIYLGEISFAFYLFHMLIIINISAINNKIKIISNDYLLISIIFLVTIFFSWLSFEKFEKPVANFIKNKFITS